MVGNVDQVTDLLVVGLLVDCHCFLDARRGSGELTFD